MPDHTPAQLHRILAPVWTAAPEAIPRNGDESLSVGWFGDWQWHVQDGPLKVERAVVSNEVARGLVLSGLQLAIEKWCRRLQFNPSGSIDAMWGQGQDTRYGHASHPDPIIARAMLLARIVGVELGDADA